MSETTPEKSKTRFQVSCEVQEEFVNGIAQSMLALADKTKETLKPWDSAMNLPYSPATGREYGGPNMIRLMLESVNKGYQDDRWLTFKQLQQFKDAHPDQQIGIKKGEHGVKLLRPEEVFYSVDPETNKRTYYSLDEAKSIGERQRNGENLPEIRRTTIFCPFTVFNAEQMYGLPAKQKPAAPMTVKQRDELLERFIACSGVVVDHHSEPMSFSHESNMLLMPYPDSYANSGEYFATKLRGFFDAVQHESRENSPQENQNLKDLAFQEMKAEMFSMLAGARFNLPMPENSASERIADWNIKFSGGDARVIFQAAADAARLFSAIIRFKNNEKPNAKWFPSPEEWAELERTQKQNDAAKGVYPGERSFKSDQPVRKKQEIAFADAVAVFDGLDEPVAKARFILSNPELFKLAIGNDPNVEKNLNTLVESMSKVLHREPEEQNPPAQAVENIQPLNEQKDASAKRMRM